MKKLIVLFLLCSCGIKLKHQVSGTVKADVPPVVVQVDTTPTLSPTQIAAICYQQHTEAEKVEKCIQDLEAFNTK